MVEFALFVPVLAIILHLAIDLGRAYLGWVTLTNVARIGAQLPGLQRGRWSGECLHEPVLTVQLVQYRAPRETC